MLGQHLEWPLILAPAGLVGLFWPNGEVACACAATPAGTMFTLSTVSVASLEEVSAGAPGAAWWFQLYVFRDRELTRSLVERALASGYRAPCVTVDVQVTGARERDVRNGFSIPRRVTLRIVLDARRQSANILTSTPADALPRNYLTC